MTDRIALYDVDSRMPNLALMKLSRYHKDRGDEVVPYDSLFRDQYNKIYASRVFNFSDLGLLDPARMMIGGSGWDIASQLPEEVERLQPDYTFYGYPHNIGFTSRGCRYRCKFCIVAEKEGGNPYSTNTVAEIWQQRDSDFVILLDNDFFGNPQWRDRVGELREFKLLVNFSQGLNIRIITEEQAATLAEVRFCNINRTKKQVYFAWDRVRDERLVQRGIERCLHAGLKAWQMAFYVLIGFDSSPEEDLHRVETLRALGCDPFAMPFDKDDSYQRAFVRWVNHKAIFNTVSWEAYRAGVKRAGTSAPTKQEALAL